MSTPSPKLDSFSLYPEDFDRYLPNLPQSFNSPSEDGKQYLAACRAHIVQLMQQGCASHTLINLYSVMIDKLIRWIFQGSEKEILMKTRHLGEKATLIALGGYGREEMNLHSDIDLLFIYPKKKGPYIESLTERVLYILWDLGLDVGHATRTLSECREGMLGDVTIMTALLDARYLSGNEELSGQLLVEIQKVIKAGRNRDKFIKQKVEERKQRILKQGDSVFVLEPNIRDSQGGLRDLQLLLWIAKLQGKNKTHEDLLKKGFLHQDEYNDLMAARNFLWRLRNELHLIVGKKVDILTFDRQEKIAASMGYTELSGILAVERLMQDYYRHTNKLALIVDMVVNRMLPQSRKSKLIKRFKTKKINEVCKVVDGTIQARKQDVFIKDPINMIRLFAEVQHTGLPLHPNTKDLIATSRHLVDDSFRANSEALALFRSMLNSYENLGKTLLAMHEVHFLEEWLPEFKKLVCRVQHDAYHIYTIDTHSIFAVGELSKLYAGQYGDQFPVFRKALLEVPRPEMLTLGLFLHDIGKGEGGNHSVKGAVIGNGLTQRIGFNDEEQKMVEFLIISHLIMPHLSQRRDLEDQEMIIQFASSMGSLERLNMLFLLTWADIRAVGPNAWSDWKGSLLVRLYEKAREVIEKGDFSREKTTERVARVKEELLLKLGGRLNREEFQNFLHRMPPRYFFASGDEAIEWHYRSLYPANLSDSTTEGLIFASKHLSDPPMTEFLIYTLYSPQILSQITGVMSAMGVNILKVDLFQMNDGHVLILVGGTNVMGESITREGRLELIHNSLRSVVYGQMSVSELISKNKEADYLTKKPVQKATSKVVVDNDVSAYYTVIDVYAHDRLGLLYEITQTLNRLGCYVEVSKISTKVEQVSDVFYVKDIFGKKIESREKLKQIKSDLLSLVEVTEN